MRPLDTEREQKKKRKSLPMNYYYYIDTLKEISMVLITLRYLCYFVTNKMALTNQMTNGRETTSVRLSLCLIIINFILFEIHILH